MIAPGRLVTRELSDADADVLGDYQHVAGGGEALLRDLRQAPGRGASAVLGVRCEVRSGVIGHLSRTRWRRARHVAGSGRAGRGPGVVHAARGETAQRPASVLPAAPGPGRHLPRQRTARDGRPLGPPSPGQPGFAGRSCVRNRGSLMQRLPSRRTWSSASLGGSATGTRSSPTGSDDLCADRQGRGLLCGVARGRTGGLLRRRPVVRRQQGPHDAADAPTSGTGWPKRHVNPSPRSRTFGCTRRAGVHRARCRCRRARPTACCSHL